MDINPAKRVDTAIDIGWNKPINLRGNCHQIIRQLWSLLRKRRTIQQATGTLMNLVETSRLGQKAKVLENKPYKTRKKLMVRC